MSKKFLQRLFTAYYQERKEQIPPIDSLNSREFGFIPWEESLMIRHVGFDTESDLKKFLIEKGPRHVYTSGSLYKYPENQDMKKKGYQGCDFLIDIDVDHFYTPCKEEHDIWYCKECGESGKGMIDKCPKCDKSKFTTLNWICTRCLEAAKNEVFKLVNNFLVPDFGFDESRIKIAFSGHRGYHVKLENDIMRSLSSAKRREIVDYLTGDNISLELLGLYEKGGSIYGLSKSNLGWSSKILKYIEELLQKPNKKIVEFLTDKRKSGFSPNLTQIFLNNKKRLLSTISNDDKNVWSMESFQLTRWKTFLEAVVNEIGAEIDEPVSIDIHRLIRYPGSLHGKTGFKVQELSYEQLEDFIPLNESEEKFDPIVFESNKAQKLKIIVPEVPITKIKDGTYGPYYKGEIVDVPNHIAILFLCKEVAITI